MSMLDLLWKFRPLYRYEQLDSEVLSLVYFFIYHALVFDLPRQQTLKTLLQRDDLRVVQVYDMIS